MSQEARDRLQHEIEDEANRLFPGAVRRVTLVQPGELGEMDEQDHRLLGRAEFEPGELVPQIVFTEPPGTVGPVRAHQLLQMFRIADKPGTKQFNADGPAIKKFRHVLAERLPEVRHLWIKFENASGQSRGGRGVILLITDDGRSAANDSTAVMVRLKSAELETVDALITAGIASNRADAIRWALTRIRERPAFERLRAHTREIERLRTEF